MAKYTDDVKYVSEVETPSESVTMRELAYAFSYVAFHETIQANANNTQRVSRVLVERYPDGKRCLKCFNEYSNMISEIPLDGTAEPVTRLRATMEVEL